MLGAIAGDVIGSVHEGRASPGTDFPLFADHARFTDDTVLTVAVAEALRSGSAFREALREWAQRYPDAGYGGWFRHWLDHPTAGPYNSFGNGAAMRVAPVAWAYDDERSVLEQAERSAAVTHDHPEGIRGAQAVAAAIRLARLGGGRHRIAELLTDRFGYDLSASLSELRQRGFDVTCQGTVPAAAIAFLNADDFEGAVRYAVSIGGDADTLACIAGAMAEAFFGGIPEAIREETRARLDTVLLDEIDIFHEWVGATTGVQDLSR